MTKAKCTVKQATNNVQLVLQKCCKMSWVAMLHVLPPTFKLACVAGVQKGRETGFWAHKFPTPYICNACHTGYIVWTCLATVRLQGFFFVDGKTPNIPIQLILQQIHKTSCTFFVACFTIPLSRELNHFVSTGQLYESNCKENSGLSSQISFFPK